MPAHSAATGATADTAGTAGTAGTADTAATAGTADTAATAGTADTAATAATAATAGTADTSGQPGVDTFELPAAGSWLVLSAHLDDAVLSCGALLAAAAPVRRITVATLFTECSAGPHTRAARSFLGQCGYPDADSLFAGRRAEDIAALDRLRVDSRRLGRVDALFRRRDLWPVARPAARLLPELGHRYPTYRFDIAKGRVSRGDRGLTADLRRDIRDLVDELDAGVVFCPIGIGSHVDHLITRSLGADHPGRVVYYADFPYCIAGEPDPDFVADNGLTARQWPVPDGSKAALIREYRTQADALFPSGVIPRAPETYFVRP